MLYPDVYGYSYPSPLGDRYYKYQAYATNFNVKLPGVSIKKGEISVSKGGKNVQIKDGKVYLNGKLITGNAYGLKKQQGQGQKVCRVKSCRNNVCNESASCRGAGVKIGTALGLGHSTNQNSSPPPPAEGGTTEEEPTPTTGGTGTGDPIADFFAWLQSIFDKIFGGLG